MNGIKHVFFDLDHTLWDFEKNSKSTFAYLFQKHQIELELDDFKRVYKPINEKYWKAYREERINKPDLRYRRLADTFISLDYPIDDDLIHQLSHDYIKYLSRYNELFKGAVSILKYLHSKYKLHIITNGFNEVQHQKLSNSNIIQYFEQIITSEQIGVKKPNALIFEEALNRAKADAKESVMIGDNFEADILGALNSGMDAIFCHFNGDVPTIPVKEVYQLSEIRQYL